jgi:hypothetical protein
VSNFLCEVLEMKRLQIQTTNSITFEQGCNKYLDNCRQRNLRQDTINHYKQSYHIFFVWEKISTEHEETADNVEDVALIIHVYLKDKAY